MKHAFVILILFTFIFPSFGSTGDTFTDKGINYRVTAEGITGYTVQVDDNKVCTLNKIIIPDSVSYNSLRYAVTAIRDSAFWRNSHIDTLDLNAATLLIFIDSCAFAECDNLVRISFPDSLAVIGKNAFAGCLSLDSISLPPGIVRLDEGAFGGCISLQVAVLSEGIISLGSGSYIFSSCLALRKVHLPSTLRTIDRGAFYYCTSLKTIHLPDSLNRIEPYAFARSGLDSIAFPAGLNYLGEFAFEWCSSLRCLDFSRSVHFKTFVTWTLPASAMPSMGTIIFPPNLVTIKNNSLNAEFLKEIILPDSLRELGGGNFSVSENLRYLRLPAALDTIRGYCFLYCHALELIDNLNPIPQQIVSGGYTYPGSLDSVFYWPGMTDRSFCKLRVPCASIPLYRSAPVWKDFHILDCYQITALPNNSSYGTASGSGQFHEEMQDTLIAAAEPTYEFVYWKDEQGNIISYHDTLIITVTQDSTIHAVFRKMNAGSDAALFSLVPSHGRLVPGFNPDTFNYVDTVPYAVDSIRFHVTTNHTGAVVNPTDTTKKELSVGDNEFTITITAEDLLATETYTVNVYRLNNNACLRDLEVQGTSLAPVFDSLTYVYSAQVPASMPSADILPTLSDPKASLHGDYGVQNVAVGSNRFDILVRAEDPDTTRTYTVYIARESYPASTDAYLIQLNVNGTDMLSSPTLRFDSRYSGGCGESTFTVDLTVSEGATLNIDNPVAVTIDGLAGLDTINFTVTSETGSVITQHRLVLEKRFEFDAVVETLWNDNTFMLDIRYLNENGIPIRYESQYLWYKNGLPVFMGIYPTLSAGENASDRFEYGVPYYLEMTTDKNEKLRTCEKVLAASVALQGNVYPNPAQADEPFTLTLDETGGIIELFTLSGVRMLKRAANQREIKMSLPHKGTYVIKHTTDNGKEEIYKIMIR